MDTVDEAFYRLTVSQRNLAWVQVERLEGELKTSQDALARAEQALAALEEERDTLLTALAHIEESTERRLSEPTTPEARKFLKHYHTVAHAGLRNSPPEPDEALAAATTTQPAAAAASSESGR